MPKFSADIWWDYVCDFEEWAEITADSVEEEELRAGLSRRDWLLYVLAKFIGLMENCGYFADAVASKQAYLSHLHFGDDLKAAFEEFDLPQSAALIGECVTLHRDFRRHGEWTDQMEQRREVIEKSSDWDYDTLVSNLRAKDISFHIEPYCA